MERGITPLACFFSYTLLGAVGALLVLVAKGEISQFTGALRAFGRGDWLWFSIAVVCSALGALLSYAQSAKKMQPWLRLSRSLTRSLSQSLPGCFPRNPVQLADDLRRYASDFGSRRCVFSSR